MRHITCDCNLAFLPFGFKHVVVAVGRQMSLFTALQPQHAGALGKAAREHAAARPRAPVPTELVEQRRSLKSQIQTS